MRLAQPLCRGHLSHFAPPLGKFQISNPKPQTSLKSQNPNVESWAIGAWSLFDIWCLMLGICRQEQPPVEGVFDESLGKPGRLSDGPVGPLAEKREW